MNREKHMLRTDPRRYTEEIEPKHHNSRGHAHHHADFARWDDDGGAVE